MNEQIDTTQAHTVRTDPVQVDDGERGATMLFFALVLVIIMVASAIAVDLSALSRRGQELQNIADAAALSAVTRLVESGDEAAAAQAGRDALAMSGVTDGADLQLSFAFQDGIEAQVTVEDDTPDNFFSAFAANRSTVVRTATAVLDVCAQTCEEQGIQIDAPFSSVEAEGSGDGFAPISANGRFYALNHNEASIVCVDRSLTPAAPCWSARQPFSTPDTRTDSIVHTAVVGDRIWYGGQEQDRYSLFCWQTAEDVADDQRCGGSVALAELPAANLSHGGAHYRTRGGGLAGIDDQIYVFTDDHMVHCVNGITGTRCPGYGSARANGMSGILPALEPAFDVSGAGMDRVIHPDGRIYVSLHVMPGAEADGFESGTWVHCWDTTFNDPCTNTGFTPTKVHAEGHPRYKGRLFFYRGTDGSILGVCSRDFGEITCLDEDSGAVDGGQTATMSNLAGLMRLIPDDTVGVHMYHAPTNRLFAPSSHGHNEVTCWDFTFNNGCNTSSLSVFGTPVEAYGFVYEGDCLYGLGHTSIFFTMNPDGEPGCRTGAARQRIDPCECADGSRFWGAVEFVGGDLSISGPFERFDITVIAEENGPELVPTISMIDHPTGEVPLSGIPTDIPFVTILIEVVAKFGEEPFVDGRVPEITVTWVDRPVLAE